MKRFVLVLAIGLISLTPLVLTRPAYAASATLSLSPASSSISQGAIITVSIREDSGSEPVNGVQANLSYPADLLDFVSIGSSSAFSIVAENSGGSGSVKIGRGALPAVSGSQTVATVKFKAKTSSGSATVSFAGSSQVVSANSNTNILTSSSGGIYSLKAPAAAPAPAPAPPKDEIPPVIKDIAEKDVKPASVTISWTTSEPTTSEVSYGLNQGYGLVAADNNLVTDHKIVLSSALLAPGTTYHYMIKSTDAAGNNVSSPDRTFTTIGATLFITVINQNNKPVSKAKVTLGERSGVTNNKGQVSLQGLPLGKQVGTVEVKGEKTVVSTEVKAIDPDKIQAVTFKVKTKDSPVWIIILPLLALLALVALLLRGKLDHVKKYFSGLEAETDKKPGIDKNAASQSNTPEASIIKPTKPPK